MRRGLEFLMSFALAICVFSGVELMQRTHNSAVAKSNFIYSALQVSEADLAAILKPHNIEYLQSRDEAISQAQRDFATTVVQDKAVRTWTGFTMLMLWITASLSAILFFTRKREV